MFHIHSIAILRCGKSIESTDKVTSLSGMYNCRLLVWLLFFAAAPTMIAVDVSPSKRVVPKKFIDPPGKRYSIFAGDPERVQRANEVKLEDFATSLKLEPEAIQFSDPERIEAITMNFIVENKSERAYTLSFPDAQRYDYAIVTNNDELVYLWSSDKAFVQQTGMSFVNGGEKLQFSASLPMSQLKDLVVPGTYKVVMILSNYPELKAASLLKIAP
jgi:hypothetical protein